MIYTVTFNPSLDYIVRVDDFKTGTINRCNYEMIRGGGKGINVSIVLGNLGHESCALGFIAGKTGDMLASILDEYHVNSDFIRVKNGFTRINVKMKSNAETEINGQGPKISKEEVNELLEKLDLLNSEDILVISGTIPSSLPSDMYEKIMARLADKKMRIVVDASNDLLVKVLKYHPFLIKPNNFELAEIFKCEINGVDDIVKYGKKLQDMGAKNVLVSRGKDGALLIDEDGKVYESEAPKGELVNSVGAGDSMVAGFISGYLETHNYEEAFYKGICSGSASAFSEDLATLDEVNNLLKQIRKG